jgi:uncharacterized protein YndB with AHSA1/START domain
MFPRAAPVVPCVTMSLEVDAVARAEMLIRKPLDEVFEAFVNPEITTRFWFSRASGRLDQARELAWEWGMLERAVQVKVKALEKNKRILIEWSAFGAPTTVEWTFVPRDDATYLRVRNWGFSGSSDSRVRTAIESTEAFTLVLVGAKAWLEQGVVLNLISDRHPHPAPAPSLHQAHS